MFLLSVIKFINLIFNNQKIKILKFAKMVVELEKVFGLWDYVVFVGLLVSSTFIGIFFAWQGRNEKNSANFFTGGRKLAVFPVTMSLIASFMSTNTLLGVPAEVYQLGTQFAMQIISITLVIIVTAEVFMPVYFSLGITSVNEVNFLFFCN